MDRATAAQQHGQRQVPSGPLDLETQGRAPLPEPTSHRHAAPAMLLVECGCDPLVLCVARVSSSQ